jgi:prepilin-type N-terminal cleavage/methylation domain-containing protein
MNAIRREDSGFTLTELLVVCVLLAITLSAAWSLMQAVSLMTNKMSARANAADESQTFVDRLESELLQANSLKSIAGTATTDAAAQAAFYDVQPREIGFYADLDQNGRPDRIAYYMDGSALMRQQTTASGTSYPYSWNASSAPVISVGEVDPAWDGAIFTYFGSGNWPPTPVTDVSDAATITVVTVEVRNVATWGDQTISYDASSTVRVRSANNGF